MPATSHAQTVNDPGPDLGDGTAVEVITEGLVPSTRGAGRDHKTISPNPADPDEHCAEWEQVPVYGPGTVAVSAGDDSDATDPDAHPDQDLLDAILASQNGGASSLVDDTVKDYTASRTHSEYTHIAVPTKVEKSATNRSSARLFFQDDETVVSTNASTILLLEIQAQEEADAAAAAAATGSPSGGSVIVGYDDVCVLHFVCGGERIDDALLGHISDESDGDYAEYVNFVGSMISAIGSVVFPGGVTVDNGTLGANIATTALGPQSTATAMPVFYFCRSGVGGPIELTNPGYGPSFGWDTTVAENYDIPGARFELREKLIATLQGELPQMQTIPPIELGYTFVKVPMWLWLIEPFEFVSYGQENSVSTVRVANRATLVDVTWELGGETYTCTIDELREFVNGVDSITDTAPKCAHRFFTLDDFTITATTRYFIEEQISYRGATTNPWPAGGWYPHPTSPEEFVPNQTGPMQVHTIVSVNVPGGMTVDEARIAANGN